MIQNLKSADYGFRNCLRNLVSGLRWAARTVGWIVIQLVTRFENYLLAPLLLAVWRRKGKQRFLSRPRPPGDEIDCLGLEPPHLVLLKGKSRMQERIQIGEFDQDGFLLSEFGPIRNFPNVTTREFMRRKRFSLRLVLSGGSVGVEKDYRGVKSSFVREVVALRRLNAAGCHVPAILDLDFKRCCLTMSLIKGKVLREELVRAGAVLRDRDAAVDPEYRGLSREALRLKRIEAGRKVLRKVVTGDFLEKLYRMLQDIHTAGVALKGIKYGNIIIEEDSGEPYLIDFEGAAPLVPCGRFLLNLLFDYDTKEFNLHFSPHHHEKPLEIWNRKWSQHQSHTQVAAIKSRPLKN